jgi:hypothetical protein
MATTTTTDGRDIAPLFGDPHDEIRRPFPEVETATGNLAAGPMAAVIDRPRHVLRSLTRR